MTQDTSVNFSTGEGGGFSGTGQAIHLDRDLELIVVVRAHLFSALPIDYPQ